MNLKNISLAIPYHWKFAKIHVPQGVKFAKSSPSLLLTKAFVLLNRCTILRLQITWCLFCPWCLSQLGYHSCLGSCHSISQRCKGTTLWLCSDWDKGYLSAKVQLDFFQSLKINLKTPMRKNQLNFKNQPFIFKKVRKRIETLFSQLCDQFMIHRNYAKSFDGFRTRILSKISSLTLIQHLNKFVFNRPINNIKLNLT